MLRRAARETRSFLRSWATRLKPRHGVLVYVGLHKGGGLEGVFHQYKEVHGFEANPDLYEIVRHRHRRHPWVHIHNLAVATHDGEIEFHISSNDGASSSIGHFDERWEDFRSGQVQVARTIRVRCVNLCRFLDERGITFLDEYISDIQGMDLAVLKTLKPLLDARRIGAITCEVAKDRNRNIYKDLPDNNESGFQALLGDQYQLVARGCGLLRDGEFKDVPDSWWEMDCKWRLKA